MLHSLHARALRIPFRAAFSHAAASRAATQSIWVEARDAAGRIGYGEGCPREYVTGETLESALRFVARHHVQWRETLFDLASLKRWMTENRLEIDAHPSAWAAVELAVLDLLGQRACLPVERLLGLDPLSGSFRYTAVIGDGGTQRFRAELDRYRQAGFRDFKIKLSGELARDREKVAALHAAGVAPHTVRADANNLWADASHAISHLTLIEYPFTAIEEPLHAHDYAGMARLAQARSCAIILDESLLREDQIAALQGWPVRWLVNVRVSKMGGVLRSLAIVDAARRARLSIVVGAHVGETSLLARAALPVAAAARDILLAQEGAFGTHLLERDVTDQPIMFGPGGILDAGALAQRPGWGIARAG